MNWFGYSLLSISALATAELTQQYLLSRKNAFTERTSASLTFAFQSLLAIPFLFLFGLGNQLFDVFQPYLLLRTVLVAAVASVAMVFYLRSFKVKNISFSLILISSSVVVSTMMGILFLGEAVELSKFFGIGLILIAIVILNIKNSGFERNHVFGLLAGLMFGLTYTLDKSVVQHIHPFLYIFWSFFFVGVLGFLFNPKEVIGSMKGKKVSAYKPIMLSGTGYFLYNFFTFKSYTVGGEIGSVDAINNTQVFLVILFEYFVLKNTKGVFRKILTAGLAITGVLILGFF